VIWAKQYSFLVLPLLGSYHMPEKSHFPWFQIKSYLFIIIGT